MDPHEARLELAGGICTCSGPATPEAFKMGRHPTVPHRYIYNAGRSLTQVHTPIGEAWILKRDEPLFLSAPSSAAPARLLPSGDTWFLLQDPDRELLLPDESQRRALWTSRVWPGALLVEGETVGTWRRGGHVLAIQPWRRLSTQRDAVEAEAGSLLLPGINRPMDIHWDHG
jgi:hypothetical protein